MPSSVWQSLWLFKPDLIVTSDIQGSLAFEKLCVNHDPNYTITSEKAESEFKESAGLLRQALVLFRKCPASTNGGAGTRAEVLAKISKASYHGRHVYGDYPSQSEFGQPPLLPPLPLRSPLCMHLEVHASLFTFFPQIEAQNGPSPLLSRPGMRGKPEEGRVAAPVASTTRLFAGRSRSSRRGYHQARPCLALAPCVVTSHLS